MGERKGEGLKQIMLWEDAQWLIWTLDFGFQISDFSLANFVPPYLLILRKSGLPDWSPNQLGLQLTLLLPIHPVSSSFLPTHPGGFPLVG